MTRTAHDRFAKEYFQQVLGNLGEVEISLEIRDEVRQVDVWFVPAASPESDPENLGLLGKMISSHCLIEPFRNQPSKTEIRNCMLKLFAFHGKLQRDARRESDSLTEDELPSLWILATSASAALLNSFGAKPKPNWPQGVYCLDEALKTNIIVINQLPQTPETLWLRILGKGKTQERAINELIALPESAPKKSDILELLFSLRITIETQEDLTEDDRELLMYLSPAYLERREAILWEGRQEGIAVGLREGLREGLQEGRQEGRQEGKKEGEVALIMRQLYRRLGAIDPMLTEGIRELSIQDLEDLGVDLLDFATPEDLVAWLDERSQ